MRLSYVRRHFTPGFPHFVAFPSSGGSDLPKVGSSTTHHREPQMVTATFTFITIAFFAAVVADLFANVVEAHPLA